MICYAPEIGFAAILGGLTVVALMLVFLCLCVVMKAIAYVLSYDLEKVLKLDKHLDSLTE
jgi:hypothetical protein